MSPPPLAAAGLVMAVASATLYGLNIGYARLASFEGVSGSTIVVYRVVLMLALVSAAAAGLRRSLRIARGERGLMIVLGLATTLIGVCYLSAVAFIPVAVAVVVFYTYPVMIVLASPVVDGTRLTPTLLGVVALALAGVVLVVGPAFQDLDWRGLALALCASLATATQFFAAARSRRTGVYAKVFWIHVLVLPAAALIGLAAGNLAPPSNLLLAPYAVAMTVGGYVIGFVLQFMALVRIPAVAAGIIFCAEPVVAALSSTVILDEPLSPVQWIGGALVLAAIVANVVMAERRTHTSAGETP
ncbi:MAG: DMT family transporter [Pseudomonadota bacterium]|nr:DMT family transporter [Pseudomonadota bacterium]